MFSVSLNVLSFLVIVQWSFKIGSFYQNSKIAPPCGPHFPMWAGVQNFHFFITLLTILASNHMWISTLCLNQKMVNGPVKQGLVLKNLSAKLPSNHHSNQQTLLFNTINSDRELFSNIFLSHKWFHRHKKLIYRAFIFKTKLYETLFDGNISIYLLINYIYITRLPRQLQIYSLVIIERIKSLSEEEIL